MFHIIFNKIRQSLLCLLNIRTLLKLINTCFKIHTITTQLKHLSKQFKIVYKSQTVQYIKMITTAAAKDEKGVMSYIDQPEKTISGG